MGVVPRDWTLSFLDDVVVTKLENGQQPYKPRSLRRTKREYEKMPQQQSSGRDLSLIPYSQMGPRVSMSDTSQYSEEMVVPVWTLEGRMESSMLPPTIMTVSLEASSSLAPRNLESILTDEWS